MCQSRVLLTGRFQLGRREETIYARDRVEGRALMPCPVSRARRENDGKYPGRAREASLEIVAKRAAGARNQHVKNSRNQPQRKNALAVEKALGRLRNILMDCFGFLRSHHQIRNAEK